MKRTKYTCSDEELIKRFFDITGCKDLRTINAFQNLTRQQKEEAYSLLVAKEGNLSS